MSTFSETPRALDHQSGTRRVFLVHLRLDANPRDGRCCGRVQHVASGDAAHFDCADELIAFMASRVPPD